MFPTKNQRVLSSSIIITMIQISTRFGCVMSVEFISHMKVVDEFPLNSNIK